MRPKFYSFGCFFELIFSLGDYMLSACERCVHALETAFLLRIDLLGEFFVESVCNASRLEEVATCR